MLLLSLSLAAGLSASVDYSESRVPAEPVRKQEQRVSSMHRDA